jgi:hypothetical protein
MGKRETKVYKKNQWSSGWGGNIQSHLENLVVKIVMEGERFFYCEQFDWK